MLTANVAGGSDIIVCSLCIRYICAFCFTVFSDTESLIQYKNYDVDITNRPKSMCTHCYDIISLDSVCGGCDAITLSSELKGGLCGYCSLPTSDDASQGSNQLNLHDKALILCKDEIDSMFFFNLP